MMTTLRLQCAEILHELRHKPIMITSVPDGVPEIIGPKDKHRIKLLNPIISKIHQSQKFMFDSGKDIDEQTVSAVKDTAVNMIEADLFHQPYPVMWVEDPFEDDPENKRYFYLAIEEKESIEIHFFSKMVISAQIMRHIPEISYHPFPLVIDLKNPSDKFTVMSPLDNISGLYASILGEAIYSFKKLLVTLNTENLVMDKVRASAELRSWGGNPRTRPYDHSIVRVPVYASSNGAGTSHGATNGMPLRRQLVRGYIYGKHTRPAAEQRWVRPYWRGEHEIEINERSHYVVR